MAGDRMWRVGDRWLLSSHEGTALQRPGYEYGPTVIFGNGSYRMFWCGSAPSGDPFIDHLWTADSFDGVNWVNSRVALGPGARLKLICDPSVLRIGSLYFLYFTGTENLSGTFNQVYMARSSDGENWTMFPSNDAPLPVIALPQGATGYGIGQPSAILRNGRIWLYYTDTTRDGGGTFLASSSDGVNFVSENDGRRLLATNSVDVKYSTALDLFVMVHGSSHDRLYFSTSRDGIRWELPAETEYLAQAPGKNKSFEGGLAGSPSGTIETWAYYYFASHQGTPGLVQEPLSWDLEVGRLALTDLPALGTVFRFHSPGTIARDHLYDTKIATPRLYDYQTRAFALAESASSGLLPFFRLYHPLTQDHFYTTDTVEKQLAMVLGYRDEGVLGYAAASAQAGTVPLFRLFHARGDHFYTVDEGERDAFLAQGYRNEGIAALVWPADLDGQPPELTIQVLTLLGSPHAIRFLYDASGVAGSFDVRLEIADAGTGFQVSTPGPVDSTPRFAQRIAGNSGTLLMGVNLFPDGLYAARITALDKQGRPLGSSSNATVFRLGLPPPPDFPPFGFIDLPAELQVVQGQLVVEGWALDDSGVTGVEILLAGQSIGAAVRGRSRPDVALAFPGVSGAATSGYRLQVDVSGLTSGVYAITVEVTDTLGQKSTLGPRSVRIENDANQAPFGSLDVPGEGAMLGAQTEVGGWALDDQGVARVELWLNGTLHSTLPTGFLRPDVAAVFPGFPGNPNAGFSGLLQTGGLAPGSHRLRIRIVDLLGRAADLPERIVVKN